MSKTEQKVALVTGAGRGVGARIAQQLARMGIVVAVNDIDVARTRDVVGTIEIAGGRGVSAPGDVGDHSAMANVVSELSRTVGAVDILVNNAGIPTAGITLRNFADTEPSEWEALLQVNVHGVLNCTHAVIPGMVDGQWGRIVTISSDAGRTGEAMMAAYSMSKAAGAGLMRSLAKELGPHGITCNSLSLGTIGTEDMHRSKDERTARHLRRYPLRRFGRPADVVAAIAWLVSEDGGWITGQTIPINGGYATS